MTPRPLSQSTDHCTSASQDLSRPPKKPQFQSKPFISQYDRVQAFVLAQETATAAVSAQRAFDRQLSEVEDLLDAKAKLRDIHTLAADDRAIFADRSASSRVCSCCHPKSTVWSGTSTTSDIFNEDGRIHPDIVERWLEGKKSHSGSDAKLTRRGVDCRLNVDGKVYEWVIFL